MTDDLIPPVPCLRENGSRAVCAIVGCKPTNPKWNEDVYHQAFWAGEQAARLGFAVCTGGLLGVMEAAAAGARGVGGLTIGILPGADRERANPHLDIILPTGIGFARNVLTALACDIMVAVPGGFGTLQEMTFASEYGRPVLSWGSWPLHEFEEGTRVRYVDALDFPRVTSWLQRQRDALHPRQEALFGH